MSARMAVRIGTVLLPLLALLGVAALIAARAFGGAIVVTAILGGLGLGGTLLATAVGAVYFEKSGT